MDCRIRILELRKAKKVSQRDIGGVLGIAQKTYSDYESGRIRIPVEYLLVLAKYYNVDMNYICGVTDEPVPFPTK